jgi:4-carboxymuconolactone decarboxylase
MPTKKSKSKLKSKPAKKAKPVKAKAKPAKAKPTKGPKKTLAVSVAAGKRPKPRLVHPNEDQLTEDQRELRDAIKSGPRGRFMMSGPFAIWMEAPQYGSLAQELGGFVRYQTSLLPRLSEFAILCTARHWLAQYEWSAHAPMAEEAGVSRDAVKAIQEGRRPGTAPADELAIYDFVRELYRDRRVSDGTYKRVHDILGNRGTVELIGILGYYATVSMMLNVFRSAIDPRKPLPFAEPATG